MTVLNFPSTAGKPTDGSFQYIANGVVYSWDGEKWVSNTQSNGGGGGRAEPVHFDGPDAPDFDSLIAGDQWYNTNDGRLYTYTLNDNNDLVWVDASPDSQVPQFWERTGTTLEPTNDGDDIETTGDLSAALVRTDRINVLKDVADPINANGVRIFDQGGGIALLSMDGAPGTSTSTAIQTNLAGGKYYFVRYDGTTGIGDDGSGNPNITLNAQGNYIGYRASTSAAASVLMLRTDTGGTKADTFGFYCDGSAKKPGGGSWGAMSDRRVKEDIADYSASLSSILQLTPRSYRYVGNPQTYIGLIAQEAEGAMPELVTKGEGTLPDGTEVDDFRTLDQTPLTFALINAVKEMATRIEALDATNASLEARLTALEGGN